MTRESKRSLEGSDKDNEERGDLNWSEDEGVSDTVSLSGEEGDPSEDDLEPFNMRGERLASDNFDRVTFELDPEGHMDNWLAGVTREDIRKAAAAAAHEKLLSQRSLLSKRPKLTCNEAKRRLFELLNERDKETVIELLGSLKRRRTDAEWSACRNLIDEITELASVIMDTGDYGIYQTTRDALLHSG